MDYLEILCGKEEPLDIYQSIIPGLEDFRSFPELIEPIYSEASALDDDTLDKFRFALIRLQIYADIHRNEDMEMAQKIKYVAQVLEKIIFGSLLLEHEELRGD